MPDFQGESGGEPIHRSEFFMTFDPKYFFAEFRHSLNLSRGRDLVAKTYNADDTLRIFEAVDAA